MNEIAEILPIRQSILGVSSHNFMTLIVNSYNKHYIDVGVMTINLLVLSRLYVFYIRTELDEDFFESSKVVNSLMFVT